VQLHLIAIKNLLTKMTKRKISEELIANVAYKMTKRKIAAELIMPIKNLLPK
jgi:hypothetical protein